ncbi:MAG: S8 family serine peptidase [Anaerolineae bacterium]|nr:S8 family serine peptidase [Anaerolineae bacterium]
MEKKRVSLIMATSFGLAGLILLAWIATTHAAVPAAPANVAPQVWEAVAGGGETEFLVILGEQADLSGAAALPNREARLRYVYDALRKTALRTQAPLRVELDAAGVAHRSFYIVNAMVAKGNRALVTHLAARPDVARIVANPSVRQTLPDGRGRYLDGGDQAPTNVEWGVARINADDVWTLGYTGTGIVVAGQDTGYDWDHPALVNQYRGYGGVTATHDYNWHDAIHTNSHGTNPCGVDSAEPCDDKSHGTHTMGTIVGDDGGSNQIGVAPGAQWIGCRNMDNGYGTPATYIECFEFFLAPYPVGGDPLTEGDPTEAPHVVNNSWVCPPSEGCDWTSLQTAVENVRAAGIVVVASAGNEGTPDKCERVMYPPAIYDAAFSIGATDSSDNIATFSSRGPVTVDGSNRRKPDVSAPGVSVRSSLPGGGYGLKDGTSMAGPHVAGTVALLWSSAPYLVGDVDATEWIIAHTARPRTTTQGCGGDGPSDVPNNVYGWGIVDALAAVRAPKIFKKVSPEGFPTQQFIYTLTVVNTRGTSLTQIVLTDTVPVSTTFAWASGNYVYEGGVVTWTAESLADGATLTATLAVTVAHLPRGTVIVNGAYGARASEHITPVMGIPVESVVPWQYTLPIAFRDWSFERNGDG